MTLKTDLQAIRTQVKREGLQHVMQLTEAQRETLREALRVHIARGTATKKMLQLAKLHGVSV